MNQYFLYQRISRYKEGSATSDQSQAILKIYQENQRLKEGLDKKNVQKDGLAESKTNRGEAQKILELEKDNLSKVTGEKAVSGPGVKVIISHWLVKTQIIDIVNALRGSSAEAISINGKRIFTDSSLSIFADQKTYEFLAIGDRNILFDALNKPGGVFDSIVNGQAEIMNEIILPKLEN